ncbi:hypothetical protein ACQKGL_19450 [Ensifer adhaerens]|uniref:hypothetical protein n=1 Tax=Ensifer adhaerens TaxID=106592 RepID=UPI003D069EAB
MRVMAEQEGAARDGSLAFTAEGFLRHPDLRSVLQASARDLMAAYDMFPRIARLVASHQKWTLSQAVYALHLEREPGNPETGITTARLLKFIHETGGASRNTAAAFIAELVTYKLLRDAEGGRARKKIRPLEPTEVSEGAMLRWFMCQMGTLDRFDGRCRVARVEADRSIFERAQPIGARLLLSDRRWTEPPEGVAAFVWTECGGLLLDDLMARPKSLEPVDGKVWLEANLSDLATHYMISNTHIRRIFTRAQDLGLLGRADQGQRGLFWLSERLIEEYCHWQAVKLAGLANGFRQAERPTESAPE